MRRVRGVRRTTAAAVAGLAVLTVVGTAPPVAAVAPAGPAGQAALRCTSGVPGDVNGDGYAEAAVGEPGDAGQRGSVHVAYGQRSGLTFDARGTALDDQYLSQDSPGVPGVAEPGDRFGTATVLADLNGDGCADLAVGSPGENASVGYVVVFYGSPSGLSAVGVQGFGTVALFGSAARGAEQEFGDTLAAGDLNGDGIDDLAAGVSGLDVGGQESAGGVALLYGSASGLDRGRDPASLLTADTPGIPGSSTELAGFGEAVATGDFDGNGTTELAIGITGGGGVGAVQVVSGTPGDFRGGQRIGPGSPGLSDQHSRYCAFGFVLASGDVQGDGRDDLAVADPNFGCQDEETEFGMGAVVLLPGSATGLTTAHNQFWTQGSPGVAGSARLGNVFGESLAMGPLDRGATADLAIGAPGDADQGGSVTVLLGGAQGLTTAGTGGTRYTQSTTGIVGTNETGDDFGEVVRTAFLQSRAQASLLIGAPGETVGTVVGAGSLTQLSISTSGPNPGGSQTFTADSRGVRGTAGRKDHFGGGTRRWG